MHRKKDEKMQEGDGRINKEERQHIKCLNPRRALCSSSLSFPFFFPVTSADLSILVTECLISGRGRFSRLCSLLDPQREAAAALTGGAAPWVALLLQSPSFCCTVAFFFMTINLLNVTAAHTCDCCYGDL